MVPIPSVLQTYVLQAESDAGSVSPAAVSALTPGTLFNCFEILESCRSAPLNATIACASFSEKTQRGLQVLCRGRIHVDFAEVFRQILDHRLHLLVGAFRSPRDHIVHVLLPADSGPQASGHRLQSRGRRCRSSSPHPCPCRRAIGRSHPAPKPETANAAQRSRNRAAMPPCALYGSANAITVSARLRSPRKPPPVAVITMYCLPSFP